MYQNQLSDPNFHQLLMRIDEDLAAQTQAGGCPVCGGRLHSANYPRKPRGIAHALREPFQSRFSFCCAEAGCRRRCTPPSVRFLGRRVWLGAVVVMMTALRCGVDAKRAAYLRGALGVPRRTVQRWRQWWREGFVHTDLWLATKGRFVPVPAAGALPDALLGRLGPIDEAGTLAKFLRYLGPVTTATAGHVA